jgi:hypothetical protein
MMRRALTKQQKSNTTFLSHYSKSIVLFSQIDAMNMKSLNMMTEITIFKWLINNLSRHLSTTCPTIIKKYLHQYPIVSPWNSPPTA